MPAADPQALTPTTYEAALDWSRRCRVRPRTRRRKVEDGMRIRLASPVTLSDGHVGQDLIVVKHGSRTSFKCDKGFGRYHIGNFRHLAWTIVPETKMHRTVSAARFASATPA